MSSDREAREKAIFEGKRFMEESIKVFFGGPCNFEVTPTSEIERWPSFVDYESSLWELIRQNPSFHEAVRRDAVAFIERQSASTRKAATSKVHLCERYIVEEMAIYSALSDLDLNLDVYPGPELPVLVEVVSGRYQEAPSALRKRINVSLVLAEEGK